MAGFVIPEGYNLFVEAKYKQVEVDVLGNVLLAGEHTLDKYNMEGKLLFHYNNTADGAISDMDANDALNVVVYFRDFQKVVILDSDLSPKTEAIDLGELGYDDAALVCSAFSNGLWIWDEQRAELIHIDNRLQADQRSGNIHALTGTQLTPVKMRESNRYLVLLDKEQGFFFFDRYGAYVKHLPYTGVDDFTFEKQKLVFLQNNQLVKLNLDTREKESLMLEVEDLRAFSLNADKLLLLNNKGEVYIR